MFNLETVITFDEEVLSTAGQYGVFDQEIYALDHETVIGRIYGIGTVLKPWASTYLQVTYAIDGCGEFAVTGKTALDNVTPSRQPIIGGLDAYNGVGEIKIEDSVEENGSIWYDIQACFY